MAEGVVLLTGATGFVGRHLANDLWEAGLPVVAAFRSTTTIPGPEAGPFWAEVVTDPSRLRHLGDLRGTEEFATVLEGVSHVVHAAGLAHRVADPKELMQINGRAVGQMAATAARFGVQRFVLLSSIAVYGTGPKDLPVDEETPVSPDDGYSRSKLAGERALNTVSQRSNMEAVIVRPPLVYGPGVPANFRRLLTVVDLGVPLPFKSVQNQRSFIYVANLSSFVAVTLTDPSTPGQTYVISDGRDWSTPELIEELARGLGRPARLVSIPPSVLRLAGKLAGQLSMIEKVCGSLTVDSTKANSVGGWTPPFCSEHGIAVTADWFRRKNGLEARM